MRTILPQDFTIVFFPANFITEAKVFDLATKIKQQVAPAKLQVNNMVSLPDGMPAPFPFITASLSAGWKVTITANRVDCILQQFNLTGKDLPDSFFDSLVPLFTALSSLFPINRIGAVGRYQDISENGYEELSKKFFVPHLQDKQEKLNSLGFYAKREKDCLSFFDNFQFVRKTINKDGKNIDSFSITRDLNTGKQENNFTENTMLFFFQTARSLLSISQIEEVIYGSNGK